MFERASHPLPFRKQKQRDSFDQLVLATKLSEHYVGVFTIIWAVQIIVHPIILIHLNSTHIVFKTCFFATITFLGYFCIMLWIASHKVHQRKSSINYMEYV